MSERWRDKAAGLMCVGMHSSTLDDRTRVLLDLGVAGVLLYHAQLPSPRDVAQLSYTIKKYAGRPVFVAVDHEVLRGELRGGFTPLPLASDLGDAKDPELARNVGHILGRELRAVGIDMTMGPSLDLATTLNSELVSTCLGSDPSLVSELASELISSQQGEGVAACIQFFPFSGKARGRSSVSIPEFSHTMARLEERELRPILSAIEARVAAVMVSHVVLSEMDRNTPASLSRPLIFGLLRQKLGFRGLVIIDDVDRSPFAKRYSFDEIAVAGIASGADCFLCAKHPMSALPLTEALERAVEEGVVMPERLEAARRRMAPLFHRYVQDPEPNPQLGQVFGLSRDFDSDALALTTTFLRDRGPSS